MDSQISGLRLAGALFGLLSVAQLARFVMRIEVVAAGYPIPLWPSALAFIVLGGLSLWMWKLSRGESK
jgi:hypothetical protein